MIEGELLGDGFSRQLRSLSVGLTTPPETADRAVESRVDWEHFSVQRQDHHTIVRPFPISVDLTDDEPVDGDNQGFTYTERAALLRSVGVEATLMGIGVDRVDYTKGIPERFLAVERFLEQHPSYQGKIYPGPDRSAQPDAHQALPRPAGGRGFSGPTL